MKTQSVCVILNKQAYQSAARQMGRAEYGKNTHSDIGCSGRLPTQTKGNPGKKRDENVSKKCFGFTTSKPLFKFSSCTKNSEKREL